MEIFRRNGEFPGEMGNYILICLFVFAKKITDIYHWYFTEDYNLLKFCDITVILTKDYNLAPVWDQIDVSIFSR